MEILINISKDYTKTPGGRYKSEGDFSGEDFREKYLKPKYDIALSVGGKLVVILDGGYGYAPSFLEEAFGGLARETKNTNLIDMITIVSEEEPNLIVDVKNYICEALKELI